MSMKENRIVRSFSYMTFPFIRTAFIKVLKYSGVQRRAHEYIGGANMVGFFLLSGLMATGLLFNLDIILRTSFIAGSFVAYFIPLVFLYFLFYFKSESRTRLVESTLPDVLHMISANLRSGMTPFDAIKVTCTHDFGPLTDELRKVTSRSSSTMSFSDLLLETSKSIRSDALDRSITLFAASLRSGGKLAELLDGLAQDITDRQSLRRELIINTSTNAMFILFTIVVGTPLLLSISIYFVDVVSSLQSSSASGSASQFGLAGLGGELTINSEFLTMISYVILLFTGVLATMFIGAMIEGIPKKGLKWAPLLVGGSYLIFFISRILISTFLGNPLA